ncbi:MAG: peptide ABC transporter substrate-binding protein [Candidatus Moranbacteria bacterium]|nr:peptide ABC transporter substrate-binding protein [Candidatus Moranbacteria bacterium]
MGYWGISSYYSHTTALPSYGSEYIEGSVGQPQHINPLLAASNDVDADISKIIYNGLLKYDGKGGLIPDLAESYEISDDKTTYTFHLKKNVTWHDGTPFSARDVIFTFNLITDPAYKSPLRANWQGVSANLVDDSTVTFVTSPYAGFLNNVTFGILPQHIWDSVKPDNFPLAQLNLEPIGTGPFKYNAFQKDSKGNILSYKLVANPNYFDGKPYLSKITFNFYVDETSALDAYNRKEIMGMSNISSQKITEIKNQKSSLEHSFSIPRYSAVFFNQTKSLPLTDDKVREALNLATDRDDLIKAVLNGKGTPVYSPILPGMLGYSADLGRVSYDPERAKQILDDAGWKMSDDNFRKKNDKTLEVSIVTTDWDEFSKSAEVLKAQWKKVGVKVNINSLSVSDIQQNYIRPREYEALLFGQVMGADPDLYSFWHSAQKKDPGLNLALFGDSATDKLIEDARVEFDQNKRADLYAQFQQKLVAEIPAIFLCSPEYIYPVNKSVQGITAVNISSPAERFSNVAKWYINTKRVWK